MNDLEINAYNLSEKLINDIISNGLIFSNKTIKNFLFETSRNITLNKIFKEAVQNSEYSTEYNLACNYMISGNIFNLPKSPYKIVCLINGILYEFNLNTLSLNKFLKDFFKSESISSSFNKFSNTILKEYLLSIKKLLEGYEDKEDVKRIKEDKKDYKQVPDMVKEQIEPVIISLKNLIIFDNDLKDDLKDNLLTVLKGFSYSLESFTMDLANPLFISLKLLLPTSKEYQKYIKTIEEIFNQYSLI